MKTTSLWLIALALLTSCTSTIMDDDYSVVDPKLALYINKFKQEAGQRNIIIDDTSLKLLFGNTNGAAAVTDHSLNSILVDSTTVNWRNNPEEVLYHEFGHLFLHRGHTDFELIDTLGVTVPGSIMSTKASLKYTRNQARRPYYIDELFNPKTPLPAWATLRK